jgi:hypothetical protein
LLLLVTLLLLLVTLFLWWLLWWWLLCWQLDHLRGLAHLGSADHPAWAGALPLGV